MRLEIAVDVSQTALMADPDGQVRSGAQNGLIFRDTRLISAWELDADGETWNLLNGGTIEVRFADAAPARSKLADHPRLLT
jgi:hypothetical protein